MEANREPRNGCKKDPKDRYKKNGVPKEEMVEKRKRTVEETNVYFAGSLRKNKGTVSKDKAKQELELKQDIVLDRNTYTRLVNKISSD